MSKNNNIEIKKLTQDDIKELICEKYGCNPESVIFGWGLNSGMEATITQPKED